MQVHVDIPPDPLINFLAFCRAIARAVVPAGERELNGIGCILQKRLNFGMLPARSMPDGNSGVQAGLNSPQDVIGSDSVEVADQSASDWTALSDLTPGDRAALQALLPRLPPLICPMSEQDAAAFIEAYRKLPDRPNWEPVLFTTALIDQRKTEQDFWMHHHIQKLWVEVRSSRLKLFDRGYGDVENPNAGDFIARKDALAYLEQRGLIAGVVRDVVDSGEVGPDHGLSGEARSEAGQKDPAERRQAIYDYCHQMYRENIEKNKRYENHTKLTAEKFSISSSRVREIIRRVDGELRVVSPWRKKAQDQWFPSS